MAGQTINDRLLAAKHSIAGQGLAKSVCKATTEELLGPKKKHLDYLVHCTNEPNVSIPQLANLLIERSQQTNWIVVFKSLITTHHILCYGNERFTQYLASSNTSFQLNNFIDKTTTIGAGGSGGVSVNNSSSIQLPTGGVTNASSSITNLNNIRTGYDMSPFIRRYARYLNEKALSYRTVAFDFCKVKRGKEEGTLRTMSADKLLKTLPVLQQQLDTLLEFDCTANDLTNGVINMCFMLLFRDLIRLFAGYNDAIINLLEKYFEMNKKQCRDALDLYKKFLIRMDRVGEFLKVAENIGIDKGDIPDLTKAPNSLLDALEQHLQSLEGQGGGTNTPTSGTSKHLKSGVTALTNNTTFESSSSNSSNVSFKQQALAEEEAILNQYKAAASASTNPFLEDTIEPPSTVSTNQQILDLFGSSTTSSNVSVLPTSTTSKASDDLLQLGNPFADMFGPTPSGGATGMGVVQQQQPHQQQPSSQTDLFSNQNDIVWNSTSATNGFNNGSSASANLISVFDNNSTSVFDDPIILKPGGSTTMLPTLGGSQQSTMMGGPPGGINPTISSSTQQKKVLTGDLESSLASLAENLSISNNSKPSAVVQWNSPKNQPKPGIVGGGVTGWPQQQQSQPQPGANYRPMMMGASTGGGGGGAAPNIQFTGGMMNTVVPPGGSPRMIPPPATPASNNQQISDSLFDPFGDL